MKMLISGVVTLAIPNSAEELLAMPEKHYMCLGQLLFFKRTLLALQRQTSEHIEMIKREIAIAHCDADELDRALVEEENQQRIRIAEREYLLMQKIDKALERITRKEYGYCVETGMEIGLKRLLARPTAEYSFDEKIRQESIERQYAH